MSRHEGNTDDADGSSWGDKESEPAAVKKEEGGWGDNGPEFIAVKQADWGDKATVLAAVEQDGWALACAPVEMRGDRQVVLAAMAQNADAFEFASEELRGDREFVLAALELNNGDTFAFSSALEFVSEELRADREVVLAAVDQSNGFALKFASGELKDDRNIVLAAARKNSRACRHASKRLLSDREFVLAALDHGIDTLHFVSGELQRDREIVLAAVKLDGCALKFSSAELRGDYDIALAAVQEDMEAMVYVPINLHKKLHNELRRKNLRSEHEKEANNNDIIDAESNVHPTSVLRSPSFAQVPSNDSLQENEAEEESTNPSVSLIRDENNTQDGTDWEDKKSVLAAVKQDGWALGSTSVELRGDREVVLAATEQNFDALTFASEELRANREFMLAAVKRNCFALKHASQELRGDRAFVLAAVEEDGYAFEFASEELRGDRDFVLAVVRQESYTFEFASEELRGDQEVVLAAVKQTSYPFTFASKKLKYDGEFMLAAVELNGGALKFASEELKDDRKIVCAAVGQDGCALEFASKELKGDHQVVLAAVRQDGYMLNYASDELKANREIVGTAVEQNSYALEFASADLIGDRKIVMAAVEQNGLSLQFSLKELREDRKVVLAAVEQDGDALEFASEDLIGDREIVLAAVCQDGCALEFASEELRCDRDFVWSAVCQDGCALEFASRELRCDRDLVLLAVEEKGYALEFVSNELRGDREVVLAAVKQYGCALAFASEEMRDDREVVLAAVNQSDDAFEFASEELRGNGNKAERERKNWRHSFLMNSIQYSRISVTISIGEEIQEQDLLELCKLCRHAIDEVKSLISWEPVRVWLQAHPYEEQADFRKRSLDKKDSEGLTPLHYACRKRAPIGIVRSMMKDYPAICGAKDNQGMLPLHWACYVPCSSKVICDVFNGYPNGADKCNARGNKPFQGNGNSCVLLDYIQFILECDDTKELCYGQLDLCKDHMPPEMFQKAILENCKSPNCIGWLNKMSCNRKLVAYMMIEFYLHVALIISFVQASRLHLTEVNPNPGWAIAMLPISAAFLFLEFVQLWIRKSGYLRDFWNWIDCASISLVAASAIKLLIEEPDLNSSAGTTATGQLLMATGFFICMFFASYLKKVFFQFSTFVGGMVNIMRVLFPFIVVTLLILGAFTFMYFVQNHEPQEFGSIEDSTFSVYAAFIGGQGEMESTTLDVLFGALITVVLLNVVIAIVGEAWKDVTANAEAVFWQYRLHFIIDVTRGHHVKYGHFFGKSKFLDDDWTTSNLKHYFGFGNDYEQRHVLLYLNPIKNIIKNKVKDIRKKLFGKDWSHRQGVLCLSNADEEAIGSDEEHERGQPNENKMCHQKLDILIQVGATILILSSCTVLGLFTFGLLWPMFVLEFLFTSKHAESKSPHDSNGQMKMLKDESEKQTRIIQKLVSENRTQTEKFATVESQMEKLVSKFDNLSSIMQNTVGK